MSKYLIPAVCAMALLFGACRREEKPQGNDYRVIEGKTMGTYWRVTYTDSLLRNFQQDIDQLLVDINMDISTYIDSSTVSRFNLATDTIHLDENRNRHFLSNFNMGREAFEESGGSFDLTIMPLVNYWGFGYTSKKPVTAVDSLVIDSLMQFVGMDKVSLHKQPDGVWVLTKTLPGVQLDFGGTGQGYGVDAISELLEGRGISHYLVDIGGEQRSSGQSPRGDDWRVGINVPKEDSGERDIQVAVPLRRQAVSTSGNYRNYYEVKGVKYSHTIQPHTGYPERNTLLSASVFSATCLKADAYATAFMVLGLDKAYELAERLPDIEAYFIFSNPQGDMQVRYTDGLREWMQQTEVK
ncbi:MAG: FAD:protein FMN transferase [Saprospiraceae bacterium]|nr:FAD:protein FMN transferase [Saprospiraceae bacterium]